MCSIVSLWKAQTKNAKKGYFIKNISSPLYFKQPSSKFHRNSITKFLLDLMQDFFQFLKIKMLLKKTTTFLFFNLKYLFLNISKIATFKGTFPECYRSLAQKMKEKIDF